MWGHHKRGHGGGEFGRMAYMMARMSCDDKARFAGRFGGGGFGEGFAEGFGGRGFGGGGGGDRGFRGRGGRRRLFDGEELQLLLLALIAEAPRHGYDLIREIEARSGGVYAPSPGVVYPTLTMLDEMGWIDEVKEAGARRQFSISEAGAAQIEAKKAEVEGLLSRLAALDADRAKTDRAPLKRAMMGLHMAVREAMVKSEGETAHDVAAILDEATRKIERL